MTEQELIDSIAEHARVRLHIGRFSFNDLELIHATILDAFEMGYRQAIIDKA
jgi:hypothetical protein